MINLDFIEQQFIPDLVGSNDWPQEKKRSCEWEKKNEYRLRAAVPMKNHRGQCFVPVQRLHPEAK